MTQEDSWSEMSLVYGGGGESVTQQNLSLIQLVNNKDAHTTHTTANK